MSILDLANPARLLVEWGWFLKTRANFAVYLLLLVVLVLWQSRAIAPGGQRRGEVREASRRTGTPCTGRTGLPRAAAYGVVASRSEHPWLTAAAFAPSIWGSRRWRCHFSGSTSRSPNYDIPTRWKDFSAHLVYAVATTGTYAVLRASRPMGQRRSGSSAVQRFVCAGRETPNGCARG